MMSTASHSFEPVMTTNPGNNARECVASPSSPETPLISVQSSPPSSFSSSPDIEDIFSELQEHPYLPFEIGSDNSISLNMLTDTDAFPSVPDLERTKDEESNKHRERVNGTIQPKHVEVVEIQSDPMDVEEIQGRNEIGMSQSSRAENVVCPVEPTNMPPEGLQTLVLPPTLTCYECRQTFSSRQCLKNHINIVHGGQQAFPCDLCTARFNSKRSRTVHRMQQHPEAPLERPRRKKNRFYNCRQCQYRSDRSFNVTRHYFNAHVDQMPMHCLNGCGHTFNSRESAKTHMNSCTLRR